ncbi:glutathione S-transferase family protein [Amorphus sp. 3PC139-8]|uniref:glutathione S-transferase family protein n=1 Tax=Amorphus sp. 3PC139-8 TaxID=2735676 RepID=UPI00345D9430
MITLYWAPHTRASRIIWLLEEAGLPYSLCEVNVHDGSARAHSEFMTASPMGKVPAIRDGQATVFDSAAICGYIADRYPDSGLAPATDDPQRALYWQWMVFTPSVIEPALSEKAGGWTTATGRNAWGDFDRMIAAFEAGIGETDWVLGETFSAADIMLGSSAIFMRMFDMMPESPILNAYADRCAARPAFQRAMATEPTG